EEGFGEELSRRIYLAQFDQGRPIAAPEVMAEIIGAIGHDGAATLARAQTDEIKTKLRATTDEAQRHGIFGAPSFIASGELYWGNDRLEQALAAAQRGP